MNSFGIEQQRITDYLERSDNEKTLTKVRATRDMSGALVLAEGFEDRSLGVLEKLARYKVQLSSIILAEYIEQAADNARLRKRFEQLAEEIAPGRWSVIDNKNDGEWISTAISASEGDNIVLDITGISNRGIMGALDSVKVSGKNVTLAYSEAREYWPMKKEWRSLERK